LRYLNSEQSSTAVDGPNSVGSRASEATTWLDIEFRVPRVLNDNAREVLLFLTRPAEAQRASAAADLWTCSFADASSGCCLIGSSVMSPGMKPRST